MRGNLIIWSCGQRNEFQFTPLHKRRRLPLHHLASRRRYFNSHLYMRGNIGVDAIQNCGSWISIHASIWEATILSALHTHRMNHFNSRLYMRGNVLERIRGRSCIFQFTPLHERQLSQFRCFLFLLYFNSRLCMRGNLGALLANCTAWFISIHASAWEATKVWAYQAKQSLYFNSRLCMRGNKIT